MECICWDSWGLKGYLDLDEGTKTSVLFFSFSVSRLGDDLSKSENRAYGARNQSWILNLNPKTWDPKPITFFQKLTQTTATAWKPCKTLGNNRKPLEKPLKQYKPWQVTGFRGLGSLPAKPNFEMWLRSNCGCSAVCGLSSSSVPAADARVLPGKPGAPIP